MRSYLRLKLYTTTIFLIIALSAIYTVPAYADDETPPVEPPVATEPSEPPAQDDVTEEAPVQDAMPEPSLTQDEPAPVIEEIPTAETVESILAEVPQDTEIIILDEEGETIPLVTEEAAEAIVAGDPQWCPAGVTPGSATCTPARETFSDMLNDLLVLNGGLGPNMAGVIWIHEDYNSFTADGIVDDNSVTSLTLNGSTLTNMANFALTIQGGWTGTGKAIDTTNASEFVGLSLNILNWQNAVTLSDISITGNPAGINSLMVTTTGNITATRINVSNNSGGGAWLDNDKPNATGNVTVTSSQFNNNTNITAGLYVISLGTITLKDVTADGNGSGGQGTGIELTNLAAPTPKAITVTNITTSNNIYHGLFVNSKGLITATDLTSIGNGGNGAALWTVSGTAGTTLNGTNLFFSNVGYGLQILSNGAVKLNNINAVDNGQSGALIDNDSATPQSVTFTGTNSFKFNNLGGLEVYSLGQITVNNITANSNANSAGAYLINKNGPATSGVTLTGTNTFKNNNTWGLYLESAGAVTINTVTANGNGVGSNGDGVYINNTFGSLFKGVTLTGTNTFNDNNNGGGLEILSDGIVTLNNLNASNNTGNYGVYVNNTSSTPATPKAVTINGTNIINNNNNYGLNIATHGAITTNNLTASFNGSGYGADLDNLSATITPANVTLNGINSFNGNFDGGLYILSLGAIKANTVTVTGSVNGEGASFNNNFGSSTSSITLTGTNTFTGNKTTNLSVYSKGVISLSSVTASNSLSNLGATIDNSTAATPKAVTLSGTNNFSGNWFNGLNISSDGAITTNNLTVDENGASLAFGYGASLTNSDLGNTAGVTLTGNNSFNNNYGTGLQIVTYGSIKAKNIAANASATSYGAYLNNGGIGSIGGITLTGTNGFRDNELSNIEMYTVGTITINNLTASGSNTGYGALLDNTASGTITPKSFTLIGENVFNNNSNGGLYVYTYGVITTNNLSANGNGTGPSGGNGVALFNDGAAIPAGVTLNGTNTFTGNDDLNIQVHSLGNIKANNVTANGSMSHFGASFNNYFTGAAGNATLTGVNTFNNNLGGNGLSIGSQGMITINNVTASNNSSSGVSLDNTYSGFAAPKAITLIAYVSTNGNGGAGVQISSYGAVITNNITAGGNGSYGANIDNSFNDSITPSNVTMNGTNIFIGNGGTGLYINTFGSLTTNNVTSTTSTNGNGAEIYATGTGAIGALTLKGVNTFNGNFSTGLYIDVLGTVSLNNINASNSGAGVYINNAYSAAKPVTLTGTNIFNNNANGNGLQVFSNGVITTNNLTANNNTAGGASGVVLTNTGGPAANVTINGINTFNGNNQSGLEVHSLGSITLSNVTANYNLNSGSVLLDNHLGAATTKVTLTGVNNFIENGFDGLNIWSNGLVTLSKVTADGNGDDGLSVTTTGNITLTCGSFINNAVNGVFLASVNATLSGVVSAGNATNINPNGVTGLYINKIGCPLP